MTVRIFTHNSLHTSASRLLTLLFSFLILSEDAPIVSPQSLITSCLFHLSPPNWHRNVQHALVCACVCVIASEVSSFFPPRPPFSAPVNICRRLSVNSKSSSVCRPTHRPRLNVYFKVHVTLLFICLFVVCIFFLQRNHPAHACASKSANFPQKPALFIKTFCYKNR